MSQISMHLVFTIIIYIVMIGVCVAFFFLLRRIFSKTDKLEAQVINSIDDSFRKRGIMAQYKKNLSKQGIAYRAGNYDLNPSWYILSKCAVGMISSLVVIALWKFNLPAIILAFFMGFYFMGFYYRRKNEDDNKEMMMDIYNTYANLKIKLGSGIYITNALEHSHQVAQNERYKEAMGELLINLSDKTITMDTAIDIFKDRFDSREIDKLCSLLHNYTQYGSSQSYAQDIMGEIQSIIEADATASEHDTETKAGIINFAFFTVIVMIVACSLFNNFSSMDLFFF